MNGRVSISRKKVVFKAEVGRRPPRRKHLTPKDNMAEVVAITYKQRNI